MSIKNSDRFYDVDKCKEMGIIGKIKVYLNGVLNARASECLCGEDGYLITADDDIRIVNGKIPTIKLYGNVTVEIDE